MTDRLTDIVKDSLIRHIDNIDSLAENIVNDLRAKVVVPPCNVGDTAYLLTNGGNIRNLTVTHIDIRLRKNETNIICTTVFDLDGKPCVIEIVPSKIGEIFFFNLEDAQKASKEREN